MATRGKPLDQYTQRELLRVARDVSIRAAARFAAVSRNTVRKYFRKKPGMPIAN